MDLILFLICIVLVETLTELLVKSDFFKPLRKFFFNKEDNKFFKFLHDLLDCGYCTSVWISFFISVLFMSITSLDLDNYILAWLVISLVLHRFSNILHFAIDRLRGLEKF